MEEFDEPVQKVSKVFYAEMEEYPMTKTVLGPKDENKTRTVLWLPEDRIGVVPVSGGSFDMFVNKNTEPSNRARFEGETVLAPLYIALYPYDESATIADGSILFALKKEQVYKSDSFDQDAFPMIARSSDTNSEGLEFCNLCGLLEINLTGEEMVTKITFASDQKVSGRFSVASDYEEYPEIIPDASSSTTTTLNCGEGVQLNVDSPTPFYFVLPPGIYENFTIMIQTSEGKIMFKQAKNPLTIKRSRTAYAGALEYVESTSIDLSLHGTSNSYIVSGSNMYCFNASVIGNGTYGIVPDASFHTEDPSIDPVSVEVLWETKAANAKAEKGDLLSEVTLKDGYVHFISTGEEGNALIAAKDADGNILWSWHIWMTDQPLDQTYVNSAGTFVVQDRNLGATRADRGVGDQWKESTGIEYFRGRKDPFIGGLFTNNNRVSTIPESIKNPTVTPVVSTATRNGFWSESYKTIYDPCPVGYMVASAYIWDGFSINTTIGEFDNGWHFIYDGTNSTWYPNKSRGSESGTEYWNRSYMWHSTSWHPTLNSNPFYFNSSTVGSTNTMSLWEMHQVRCMKDETHVDLAFPLIEMVGAKNVTPESASLIFDIASEGASEITDIGVIYSITPGVSAGNGIKVPRTGEENSVEVTGLSEGTKYYAVAYATNSYGTTYSKEIVFYTEFANSTNLSKYGTSNCYIVSEYGSYTFDASVRGNSTESVGTPASAEVLWETKNTTKASAGDIIRSGSIQLSGNFVTFVANGVEGNALIAVKDALGTILWSWHIWVTDQPQDQHYINDLGDFYVLDRNLGATRADRGTGDEWNESSGFLYQWGRKDPFADGHYERVMSKFTIEESIEKPTTYAEKNSPWTSEWSDYLWADEKTVYDPCPVGYKISSKDIWAGFTTNGENVYSQSNINASGKYDYGWNFFIDGTNTAWFPANPHIGYSGPFEYHDDAGHAWCSTPAFIIEFKASQVEFKSTATYQAFPVRCMREHDINIVLGTSPATQITKTSAVIHGSMGYLGDVYLDEMGFVWSTDEMPVLSSSKETVEIKEGEFSCTLTGLSPATTYYVRTFATEGNITIYGPVVSFTTQLSAGNEGIPEDDDYEWN